MSYDVSDCTLGGTARHPARLQRQALAFGEKGIVQSYIFVTLWYGFCLELWIHRLNTR